MKKLTKAQAETLDMLRNGWQLGKYAKLEAVAKYRIQRGGIGKGGEARRVSSTVFKALEAAGLITCVYSDWRVSKYDAAPPQTP